MLEELHIQNFALIDNWTIEFDEGETVVTGETGSGKSLFVESLAYLLGTNVDRSMIRDEDKDMSVEASFYIAEPSKDLLECLDNENIDFEDNRLIIKRTLGERGNKQKINGNSVTKKYLESLGQHLMSIHAQNAQSLLVQKEAYRDLLDLYVGDEAQELKNNLSSFIDEDRKLMSELNKLELDPEEIERESDLLRYQINEIDSASLEEIDEESLNKEYKSLQSAIERLGESAHIIQLLSSGRDYSIRGALISLAQSIDSLYENEKSFGLVSDNNLLNAKELAWQVEGESRTILDLLEDYRSNIIVDPTRIEELDELFKLIQILKRKYGRSFEEIINFREEAAKRLEELTHIDMLRENILAEIKANNEKMESFAFKLTELRKTAASSFEDRIAKELKDMAIKHISFSVDFKKVKIGPTGQDKIDFLISTNEGEEMQSISLVASGGEMSRFMLAFTIVCSEISNKSSLVFDEIDTGISGRTAQKVSEKIAKLAENRQLIVISHLPQIAALADRHMKIFKQVDCGKSFSKIVALDKKGRIEEQARLIGGASITDITMKSAEQMLDQAEALKINGYL